MSQCELTGKKPVVKNLVSHSNIKTKYNAQTNIQKKRIFSKALNQMVRLNMAASTMRSMEHNGGIDPYILSLEIGAMSKRALAVRSRILAKMKSKTVKA
ncbi:MAG: 50S ribosomal protein L28 [Pseudobdellovibrionaceae bacterium]